MTTKSKLLLWVISVLAAFLLGMVPQYVQKEHLRRELQTANDNVTAIQADSQLAEARDLCGLMLLEVLRHNYGSAKDYSANYFEKAHQAMENPKNSSRRKGLEELLASRDSLTSSLAQGDPASASQIQALCARTYELTRSQ
jgi:hypothetical protein